ncbi:MAG: ExbD/TolR family protein [Myxococcota bacterium]|nr:ExbD/TolR family protein [Myxococcota bacterium]MDW8362625.1 ExbD/TolR family protein [Myxococcales bacterium]
MSTGGGGGRAPLSEINVTPLVDVMLVLLIIFMVAAPMLTTGIQVDLPNAEAPAMDVVRDIPLVIVTDDRRVFLGNDEVTLAQLEDRLRGHPHVRRAREAYLQADEGVPYGEVIRVMAVMRQAGVDKTGLVTDPLARQ